MTVLCFLGEGISQTYTLPSLATASPGCPHHGWQGWSLTHILLMSLSSFLYRMESFRTCRNDGDNQWAEHQHTVPHT